MGDPSDDPVEMRAKALFEAEGQKNLYWDEAFVKRAGTGSDTPLILNEADKAPYRERARALLIEELKSQR